MGTTATLSAILLLLFAATPTSLAFNITQILEGFPDFAGFNNLLSQANLPDPISKRGTVTVLVVDGSGLGAASGLTPEVLKHVLEVHVVLDYYDLDKLKAMKDNSIALTTLYQTTGTADKRQGFLNMTNSQNKVKFGSAMPGSPLTADLTKVVATKPYNLSILQVSSLIVPPGLAGGSTSPPAPPASNGSSAAPTPTSPAPPPSNSSASDAPSAAEPPAADAPAADAPAADAPVADAPGAGAPVADGPGSEDKLADDAKSGVGSVQASAACVAVGIVGSLLLGL